MPTETLADGGPAPAVGDGVRTTTWTGAAGRPAVVELRWPAAQRLLGLHLLTGPGAGVAQEVTVEAWLGGTWQEVPSAHLEDNRAAAVALRFDGTVEVTTTRLHLLARGRGSNLRNYSDVISFGHLVLGVVRSSLPRISAPI